MCPELILATIYFFVIISINIFFSKLLNSYIRTIKELQKIKNILTIFPSPSGLVISNLYLYTKSQIKEPTILKNFHLLTDSEDILVLGNCYKNLNQTFKKKNIDFRSFRYYLNLLEKQSLNS